MIKTRTDFVNAIQSCVTDLAQQYELIAAYDRAVDKETVPQSEKINYSWECNECGSQEYTMSVSEDDVHNLGCGSCGGNEWHKAVSI